jgi:chromate transporter
VGAARLPVVNNGETAGNPVDGTTVALSTICREWTRIGCTGFGGPPTHIALLRRMCVEQRRWLDAQEFEDGVAATNLLPGPASTQLAIFCAWRLRGTAGALIGGLSFILPGLIAILALASVFLAHHPPAWVIGVAAGAGAAVPAVALKAASGLLPASWARMGARRQERGRWILYAIVGGTAAAAIGSFLVLVLVACGLVEVTARRQRGDSTDAARAFVPAMVGHALAVGGLGAVALVAFKVGALSYGGGFVIVPLMQHDAVSTYHFMSAQQFLSAVVLGQVTPGPVVQTVAVVGYAAGGIGVGILAAFIAFAPSFLFVLCGGRQFDRLRANAGIQSFLTGAGAAVIGAIGGSAIPLGLSLENLWQIAVLAGALIWLLVLRRGVVSVLIFTGTIGFVLAMIGVRV